MSDARPITNVTDYVCGSCWNSFSRTDKGVLQGNQLVCPHCGHQMPAEDQSIIDAVRGAPRAMDPDSGGFSGRPESSSFNKHAEPTPLPVDAGFPDLDNATPYGWLPPDLEPGRPGEDQGLGFVAGTPDSFGLDGATLRPDHSQSELLRAVRAAPQPISESNIVGDEFPIDLEEKTPVDALAESDHFGSLDGATQRQPQGPEHAANADEDFEYSVETAAPEPSWEIRDWKLKAMGLTYNFHGLDALLNWATNKAGQTMAVSADSGTTWKDFHSFFDGVKAGLSPQNAWAEAVEPGAPPNPPRIQGGTSSAPGRRPGGSPPEMQVPNKTAPADAPASPAESTVAPVRPGNAPLSPASGPSRTVPAQAGKSLGPASAASKRTPAVAGTAKSEGALSPAKIGVIVVVLLALVVAGLVVSGVIKL